MGILNNKVRRKYILVHLSLINVIEAHKHKNETKTKLIDKASVARALEAHSINWCQGWPKL